MGPAASNGVAAFSRIVIPGGDAADCLVGWDLAGKPRGTGIADVASGDLGGANLQ